MRCFSDQNETSPTVGAVNCETFATFVGSGGWSSVVRCLANHKETLPSLGGCEFQNSDHFRGLLGVLRSAGQRRFRLDLDIPEGAANCEIVATFVGC